MARGIRSAAVCALACLLLCGCASQAKETSGKLRVVASLFPQYDFARQIAGDKAEVTLLLPPGTESHTYDPKPGDMLDINRADLFVYTGPLMEPWAARVVAGANESLLVVNLSEGIALDEGDTHDEGDAHEEAHDEGHGPDPHIWLDPTLAMAMVDNLLEGLCEKDQENAAFYTENARNYKAQLEQLDTDIERMVQGAKRHTLVFGGRFAYHYFLKRYGLEARSVFDSCSAQGEPSVRTMAEIVGFVKEEGIPCVYHEELSEARVAQAIAEQTGVSPELFSTAHNVTQAELEAGITYIDIMRGNLQRIQKGLY